jgi:hypothetical protein
MNTDDMTFLFFFLQKNMRIISEGNKNSEHITYQSVKARCFVPASHPNSTISLADFPVLIANYRSVMTKPWTEIVSWVCQRSSVSKEVSLREVPSHISMDISPTQTPATGTSSLLFTRILRSRRQILPFLLRFIVLTWQNS